MKFDIKVWLKYRKKAQAIGDYLDACRNKKGIIQLEKDKLALYISQITDILKRCSDYMDKCGMVMPKPLWRFDLKDPTTHLSSPIFVYADRLSY